MPEKFIALTRVSTRRQKAKGYSHENQLAAIKRFVDSKGGSIVREFTLTQSGKDNRLNKGALLEVIRSAKDDDASIVINTVGRLSRESLALHLLKEQATQNKVTVWIAGLNTNLNALDPIAFGALATMAEAEPVQTTARIKNSKFKSPGTFGRTIDAKEMAAKSAARRQETFRRWTGTIQLVDKIKAASAQMTNPTLKNVAVYLNGLQSETITGRPWNFGTLAATIKRLGYKNLDELLWRQIEEKVIREEVNIEKHRSQGALDSTTEIEFVRMWRRMESWM